jgi:hypothetical protein
MIVYCMKIISIIIMNTFLDGKPKKVNQESKTTYKDVKDLLISVSQSDNFAAPQSEVVPEQSSETEESIPSPVSIEPMVMEPPRAPVVVPIQVRLVELKVLYVV